MKTLRTFFSFALRLFITVGLFWYIASWINFYDSVTLKDGTVVHGKIVQKSLKGITIFTKEKKVFYCWKEIAEEPTHKRKAVYFGFFSIWKKLNIPLFLVTSFIFLINILIGSLRLQWLLVSQEIHFSLCSLIRINFIGAFFNNFLPGFTGGDVVRAYYIAQESSQKTRAIMVVLMDRVIGLSALVLLAGIMLLFHIKKPEFFVPELIVFSCLCGICLALLLMFYLPDDLYKERQGFIFKILQAFCCYRHCKKTLLSTLAISLLIHILTNFAVFGFSKSLAIQGVSWFVFFIYVPVGFLLMAIPISLSGWGVGEATYGFLFSKVGVPVEQAVALSLLVRLGQMWTGVIGGIFWFLRKKSS